jgi:hypothetical protein
VGQFEGKYIQEQLTQEEELKEIIGCTVFAISRHEYQFSVICSPGSKHF